MSDEFDPVEVIAFSKDTPDGAVGCRLEVFDDGSASVAGDGICAWFEDDTDCKAAAIQYLTGLGYVPSHRAAHERHRSE